MKNNCSRSNYLELEHDQMLIELMKDLDALIAESDESHEGANQALSLNGNKMLPRKFSRGSCIFTSVNFDDFKLAEFKVRVCGEKRISLDTGNRWLAAILEQHQVKYAGFITASNPMAKLLNVQENRQRNKELLSLINELGLKYSVGFGSDPSGVWRSETSFMVFAERKETLQKLAITCQQAAYLLADQSTVFKLIDISEDVSDFFELKPINMSRYSLS